LRQINIGNVSFNTAGTQNDYFWDNFERKGWEENTFRILDRYIKPGAIFIDIGCWEGPFTLYAASLGAVVHAIDPDEKALTGLREHLNLNPELKQNIRIHQFALTNEDKTVTLYERGRFGDSASSTIDRARDTGNSYSVQGKTFTTFLKENNIDHADLIKMDIEGGEFSVIPAMADGLKLLGFPPLITAFHAVYLKENYMKQKRFLKNISRLNGKLSIAAGKIFANKYARDKILSTLESLNCYSSAESISGKRELVDDLMHDGTVLFK